ncbi:MAG: sialidase [bacterium]|nr:sialidase [bacterium]
MVRLKSNSFKNSRFLPIIITGLVILLGCFNQSVAQQITPDVYSELKYRYIGPEGNRASAVVGVPGDPLVYYIGASSGGVWKSTDAGNTWNPMFDDQEAQSIGSLAIAPSDPNVVWAGTGEAFIRSNVSIGNGIYKSTDAGKTWQHMGLKKTGRIGRVVIDPRNPDIVLAAALGHCYGPQKERGIFRTTDGGKTWKHVLFVDEHTGCFEIAMNPRNPSILFAGMWPLVIKTYGRESGGPNGGIVKSTDGGETWKRLSGNGLPEPPLGKIGLAVSYSNPDVVYALIETGYPNRGVLWRSADGGEKWKLVSYNRILNERPHYASRILVSPADENEVYFAANTHSITRDGGLTTENTDWSGDVHDLWADHLMPDRMMMSDDGVAQITVNRGKTWNRIELPIAQMYHVAVDNQIPYYVYGGKQDGIGYKGPSVLPEERWGVSPSQWEATAGGECGFIVPDPVDPNIVWGGSFNANFTRVDYRTGHERSVMVWPESAYGSSAGLLKYRFNWTFPITISPHDHNKVYVGSQHVHQTTDGGMSWQVISPDLSTNDMSKMQPSGGLTKDNIGVEYACVVFAIAESPLEAGCIWAGTNDGLVHITRDGGKTWTNVTKNIPKLPVWGTVSNIEPSRYDAGTCYITVDFHQMNNRDPFVYKTANYGKSWASISSDIPRSVFSYAHWVHEDPKRKGMLYLGTENAIYITFNDGKNWLPIQNNLPHAPVHHMVIQEHFNDLVVGTYGRGFWIMDDITPLQQLTGDVIKSDVHLFAPRHAYRMHPVTGGAGANSHAYINYYLKKAPEGDIEITLLDQQGNKINTLKGTKKTGINRIKWNLDYKPATQAKLKTKPPGNPRVVEEKRFRTTWEREGWYPILSWGTWGGFEGIKVVPQTFKVTVKVAGKEYSQTLTVKKDPRSAGTVEDIREQVKLQLDIRGSIKTVSAMITSIEGLKRQLINLKSNIKGHKAGAEIIKAADKLQSRLQAVEDKVFQPRTADGDSKSFRYPNLLYSQLSVLGGDVASMADFAPNKQQRDVYELLAKRTEKYKKQYDDLLKNEVPAFNRLLQENQAGGIITH